MKRKMNALAGRYLGALRKHLKQRSGASLESARGLGCQAAAIGLWTRDVARVHERALATLEPSGSKVKLNQRAAVFFTQAVTQMERTHQAAGRTSAGLRRLNQRLGQRGVHLVAANRSLTKGIARQKTAEEALKKTAEHCRTLLEESLAVQKHLQQLTHQVLSEEENKRKKISLDLRDDIAQTLLGIHVRLLTLKKAAGHNGKSLQKKLASTRRLVDRSLRIVERFARELGKRSRQTA